MTTIALAASDAPQFFVYQGRFLNSAGDTALSSTVDLKLSVYSPSGDCLLYEESHSGIDLSSSNGLFSLQVGSAVGSSKRTASDPGKSMAQVFSNSNTHSAAANCSSGYTPVAGDARKLRVTVTPSGGSAVVLSPDQVIGGIPGALVADTLQGKDASQFIQVSGNVSQTTVGTLVGAGDASSLHHHDSLYLKAGSSSSQNLGSGGGYTSGMLGVGSLSAPTSSQLQVTSSGTGTKGILVIGAVSQAANLIEVQNSSSTSIFSVDASGNVSSAGKVSLKQLHLGPLTSGEETALTSTLTSSDKGKIWYSVTDDKFKYYDGTIKDFASGGGGGGGGTLASLNGLTSGTQSFAIGTSGNSPAFNSSGSTHTLNIPMASGTGVTAGLLSKSDYDTFSAKQSALGYTPVNRAGDSITGALSISPSTDVVGLTVQGMSSGTGDLLQLKTGSGSLVTKVDKDGYLTLPGAPSGTAQAATKAYVDSAISSIDNSAFLRKDGTGTATANQNLGGFKLVNVGTATATMDAANKGYVDSAITSALSTKQDSLGFTPVNKAGDSMTGSLALGTGTTLRLGRYDNTEETALTASLSAGDVGKTWFNTQSNQVKYWDGSTAQALGISGSGLISLNGQSGGTQVFAVSTSGTGAPYYDSTGNTHTLTFPMASNTGVTAGLLSKSDYDIFSDKQAAGNYVTALSGDGALSGFSNGTATLSLATGSVTGKALTGFSSGTGTISASDTILSAIGKLDGNLDLKENTIGTGSTSQYFRGDKTWQSLSTTGVSEGTNLYYTDARARAALSGANGISVNTTTGAVSLDASSSGTLSALTLTSAPSGTAHAVNKDYVDTSFLKLSGGTVTGNLNVGSGKLFVDTSTGNVGIGTTSPQTIFDISGEVKIGNTSRTCNTSAEGAIRYDSTNKIFQGCNGTSWVAIGGAAGSSPDNFTLTNLTGVTFNSVNCSNAVTISGLNVPVYASVPVGHTGSPYIKVNGSGTSTYGTVQSGNTLQVCATSANSNLSNIEVPVTVGNYSTPWNLTTGNAQPNPFAFNNPGSPVSVSMPVENCSTANIQGLTLSSPVTVTTSKGTVSAININGAGYTSYTGSHTIANNQSLCVRITTNNNPSDSHSVTVSIGSGVPGVTAQTATFTVTNPAQDTTPDSFSFTSQTNLLTNTLASSNTVTINGITGSVPVSVSGQGLPEISVAGGGWTTSTTIQNGQTLQVRLTSSSSWNTTNVGTVTLGTGSATFSVSTTADATPDSFSIAGYTQSGSYLYSNTVTVTGLSGPATVSLAGSTSPEISISSGTWTSSSTSMTNNQTIQLRIPVTASSLPSVTVGTFTNDTNTGAGYIAFTSGTNTFYPRAGISTYRVLAIGGGGGGSRGFSGGGGSGYLRRWSGSVGSSVTATVGAGGAGGPYVCSQADGSAGGASSFGGYITASGGQPGLGNGSGGAGGSGGGGAGGPGGSNGSSGGGSGGGSGGTWDGFSGLVRASFSAGTAGYGTSGGGGGGGGGVNFNSSGGAGGGSVPGHGGGGTGQSYGAGGGSAANTYGYCDGGGAGAGGLIYIEWD